MRAREVIEPLVARALGEQRTAGRVARYFPVQPEPLTVRPGLHRFGTDFGNGAADHVLFQLDDQAPRWLSAKAGAERPEAPAPLLRFRGTPRGAEGASAAALEFCEARLAAEHPGWLERAAAWLTPRDDLSELDARWHRLAGAVQEDLAVVREGPAADEACVVHVCFPSGWAPERVLGASFEAIHAPVPGFPTGAPVARLVQAMLARGPYVRFVWTVSGDPYLDHHPTWGRRVGWDEPGVRPWLRVERQVTWPVPGARAALFSIRTYLTPVSELPAADRAILREALRQMPAALLAYKRLDGALRHLERLEP